MLEITFADQPVDVDELSNDARGDDVVVLTGQTAEGHEAITTLPLEEVMNSILLMNSDLYKTGQAKLDEFELPSVLTRLDYAPFPLCGHPESDKEKLLLVTISRYIEHHAWRTGNDRLRSSFQRLSRIEDERGARTIYRKVTSTDVQTHIYGIPNWSPPTDSDLMIHGGYTDNFYDSWFVVYTSPESESVEAEPGDRTTTSDGHFDNVEPNQSVALLALETEPKRWEDYWTFRLLLVSDIDRCISRNM